MEKARASEVKTKKQKNKQTNKQFAFSNFEPIFYNYQKQQTRFYVIFVCYRFFKLFSAFLNVESTISCRRTCRRVATCSARNEADNINKQFIICIVIIDTVSCAERSDVVVERTRAWVVSAAGYQQTVR
jgi:hypothetical protein